MRSGLWCPSFAAITICSLIAVPDAAADTIADAASEGDKPLWEVSLAGFSRYGPAYPASDDYQTNIVPLPFPIYRGRFLRVGEDADKPVTTRIFKRDRIKLDLDFGLNLPVDSDEIMVRTGMPDLDLLLEVGPELEFQFVENFAGDLFLGLQTRGAISFDGLDPTWRGAVFSTELKYELPIWNSESKILVRLTPEIASSKYMDYFYGVSSDFETPERPAYKARSGYLGTRLSLSLQHEINKNFEIRTGVRAGFYQGAKNEDSPLFTADNTGGVYFAFLWKFWESKRRASAE